LGDVRIVLPLDHDLPHIRKVLPQYSLNLGRLAKYTMGKYPDLMLIDIGANVGDSAAIVRMEAQCPILCIEGDPAYFDLLQHNCQTLKDVAPVCAYVGAQDDEHLADVQRSSGTASIVANHAGKTWVKMQTLDTLLAKNPRFAVSKFVKIDTDGFDCRIIMHHKGFLRTAKPVVFFEYAPSFFRRIGDDGFGVFAILRECGYATAMFYDNVGDYLVSVGLDHEALLRDLHCHFEHRGGQKYADICAFHAEDRDLAAECRNRELEFFARFREKGQ
jgi:FkbM family methyltransferase